MKKRLFVLLMAFSISKISLAAGVSCRYTEYTDIDEKVINNEALLDINYQNMIATLIFRSSEDPRHNATVTSPVECATISSEYEVFTKLPATKELHSLVAMDRGFFFFTKKPKLVCWTPENKLSETTVSPARSQALIYISQGKDKMPKKEYRPVTGRRVMLVIDAKRKGNKLILDPDKGGSGYAVFSVGADYIDKEEKPVRNYVEFHSLYHAHIPGTNFTCEGHDLP